MPPKQGPDQAIAGRQHPQSPRSIFESRHLLQVASARSHRSRLIADIHRRLFQTGAVPAIQLVGEVFALDIDAAAVASATTATVQDRARQVRAGHLRSS